MQTGSLEIVFARALPVSLPPPEAVTLPDAFRQLTAHPAAIFLRRFNWKSSLFSSLCRSLIFFLVNLRAGLAAASGALLAEFAYRALTAGFYGSLTQHFRRVEPHWHGNLATMVLLPLVSHIIEFFIHYLRGTPELGRSIAASAAFTVISTLFNIYAMRQGVLIVGAEGRSVVHDLAALPRVIAGFVALPFVSLYRLYRSRTWSR